MREGVYGTAWEVHGGGFYHVEKFLVAPKELPPDLIWYQWEAYLTWVTGFGLLILQYYWRADVFLISPDVLPLLPVQAIGFRSLSLAGGWLIYDRICKSPIGRNTPLLAIVVFALIVAAAWFYSHVFSGRGALIHVGAFIGTIMAVNVFGIIIPNQKKIVASLLAPRGARPGARRHRQAALGAQQLPDAAGAGDDGQQPLSDAGQPPADLAGGGADRRHRRLGAPLPQPARRPRPVRQVSPGRCRWRRWRWRVAVWLTVPQANAGLAGMTVSDERGAGHRRQALHHVPRGPSQP